MVRPPQPPVFMFVIDVSVPAVVSGMLHVAAETIKACLDLLPGEERTMVRRDKKRGKRNQIPAFTSAGARDAGNAVVTPVTSRVGAFPRVLIVMVGNFICHERNSGNCHVLHTQDKMF